MSKLATFNITGASGQIYAFGVYSPDTTFKAVGALYLISRRRIDNEGKGWHTFIYIGQTGDLSERFEDHHRQECFEQQGANCISVIAVSSKQERFDIETDLVRRHSPPCNR